MRTKPQHSIRRQILLIAMLPVMMVTVTLIILIYRENIVQGKHELEQQGQLLAAQLAANLEYVLFSGAVEQIPKSIAATVDPSTEVMGTQIHQITVLDRHQQVIFHNVSTSAPLTELSPRLLSGLAPMDALMNFRAPVFLDPLDIADGHHRPQRLLGEVRLENIDHTDPDKRY